jgi:hypothetical protein
MSDWDVFIPDEQEQFRVAVKITKALLEAGCDAVLEEATAPQWVTVGGRS